jgi:uncharacterized phiE125 gp8 family phage protein
MAEICLIAPNGECIHVEEAKLDRRIDGDADDAKLRGLISAARQTAESRTRQQLLHARWKLVIDRFPAYGCSIQLPHSPLVRVVSVDYVDMNGLPQTMPATDYVVNMANTPATLGLAFGRIWPIAVPQIASVSVTYEAGYASPIAASIGASFKVTGPVTWAVGARVQFYNSGGVLPAPLDADAAYLIASAAAGTYTITDEAGTPVTFVSAGEGRSFIGVVPEGIRSWMLIRIGTVYENREEVAILTKGKLEALPYVDSLLDPYMTGLC